MEINLGKHAKILVWPVDGRPGLWRIRELLATGGAKDYPALGRDDIAKTIFAKYGKPLPAIFSPLAVQAVQAVVAQAPAIVQAQVIIEAPAIVEAQAFEYSNADCNEGDENSLFAAYGAGVSAAEAPPAPDSVEKKTKKALPKRVKVVREELL